MRTAHLLSATIGLLLIGDLAAAPKPPKAPDGDWLLLPGSVTGRRVIRSEGAAERVYRVIVEVPPTTDLKALRPTIKKSSGEPTIDEMAWEFAAGSVRGSRQLRELVQRQVAVFRLEFRTPSAATSSYLETRPKPSDTTTTGWVYYTPKPPYPYAARKSREEGSGLVRAEFVAGSVKPSYVYMERSTGSRLLDTSTLQWAILYWTRKDAGTTGSTKVPIRYTMSN